MDRPVAHDDAMGSADRIRTAGAPHSFNQPRVLAGGRKSFQRPLHASRTDQIGQHPPSRRTAANNGDRVINHMVVPHAIVVRVDRACHSTDEPRSEFHSVQALRGAFADIPILMLVDHVPSEREQEILKDWGVNSFRRLPQRRGRLLKAIDELVSRQLNRKPGRSSSRL